MAAAAVHTSAEDMDRSELSSRSLLQSRSVVATRRTNGTRIEQAGDFLDRLVGADVSVQVLSPGIVGGALLGWDERALFLQVQNGRTRLIPWTAVVWIEETDLARRRHPGAFFESDSARPVESPDLGVSGKIHPD